MEQAKAPSEQTLYDVVPYPSHAFFDTHPERMAVMAKLHGLAHAPVDKCRVLEVACGDGGNLLPMAYTLPGSEFVGFDLAGEPIERGKKMVRELGLKNVHMFQGDLMKVGAELGQFDYIIVHGLYSWVPKVVRDGVLDLINCVLAPDGVAFVSYNTQPGGYLRMVQRDMLRCLVHGRENLREQFKAADKTMRMLMDARGEQDAFRHLFVERQSKMMLRVPGSIYHDELSEVHEPSLFVDFVAHAAEHGLQFLDEAVLAPPPDPCYKAELRKEIEKVVGIDAVMTEQMLDFVRLRQFRETLLCHSDRKVSREFKWERFRDLLVASETVAEEGKEPGATAFILAGGMRMEMNHPALIEAMKRLVNAWPRAIPFAEVEADFADAAKDMKSGGAALLMRLAVAQMIELRTSNPPLAAALRERPRASSFARLEAREGATATTMLHTTVQFEDEISHNFIHLLDGTRNREELAAALKAEMPAVSPEEIDTKIDKSLNFFYRAGFFEE